MTFYFGCLFLVFGIIFLLRNTLTGYVYGIISLGNAVNLIVLSTGGIKENSFPFIGINVAYFADPLTQALVLTAIVISFATLCFVVAVIRKIIQMEQDL